MTHAELTQLEAFQGLSTPAHKVAHGKHYAGLLGNLSFIPSTKAQAKRQITAINKGYNNLLMCGQWNDVEQLLSKHGLAGNYTLTKSKTMCRLDNVSDYLKAIKLEFAL